MAPTPLQWEVYRLCVQEGLSCEETAERMGVLEYQVEELLRHLRVWFPDLFTDISGDGRRPEGRHGVSRFGGWCDGQIRRKF